jgi:hypothetical protein
VPGRLRWVILGRRKGVERSNATVIIFDTCSAASPTFQANITNFRTMREYREACELSAGFCQLPLSFFLHTTTSPLHQKKTLHPGWRGLPLPPLSLPKTTGTSSTFPQSCSFPKQSSTCLMSAVPLRAALHQKTNSNEPCRLSRTRVQCLSGIVLSERLWRNAQTH